MVASTTGLLLALLSAGAGLASAQAAGELPVTDLVGTWSSKSNSTLTGPGFYDPKKDRFTEPKLTGVSYSFSADGHFEEAYYRAVANPARPQCPKGIIQWQHGSYTKFANGSLSTKPIAVDGRQMYSDPCAYENSVYTRYNATELFKHYEILAADPTSKDPSRKAARLTLFKHDGAPLLPLYLAVSPPQMLPTTTLNPLPTATPGAKPTSKARRALAALAPRRGGDGAGAAPVKRSPQQVTADRWWWVGVVMTASGGVVYYFC